MRVAVLAVSFALIAGCGGGDDDTVAGPPADASAVSSVRERMDEIASHVAVWGSSDDFAEVSAAAEAAANLVVGPNGPGYGDRNGDGEVSGANEVGLLSGVDGTPAGIAVPLAGQSCVARDVVAGTVDDPAAAWAEMDAAIAAWAPGNNTMPTLASHPMRIVGWATFTMATSSLFVAHEYASHAQLHVDVAVRALDC